ncbi:MAG: helix-turn-helix domain-containing protein [Streptosporangiales bacterium]|nr:helix-turn-helix domain-containing protein [Streptosporangiales bacterium]
MNNEYQRALGRKIAFHRRSRGLSQREFARLIDRSEAWVSQVERGVRRIDRMSVLEHVAEVLEVPLGELAAEAPLVASASEEAPGASRLRLLLSGAHSLRAVLGEHPQPDLKELRAQVDTAWQFTHEGRYVDLTDLLESLIPDLEAAVRAATPTQRSEMFRLLAVAYQACSAALSKLGEPEAAWIATDRAIVAAERADDPLLMAAGEFRLSIVFQGARYFEQAEETSRTAAEALDRLAAEGRPEALSLWGALTLQRAVAAARLNRADDAYSHLARAREAAERLGESRNDYNTEFGPTNVALHEIAVGVELGDAGVALRTAATVDASQLSAERQARMLVDVARAHTQRRQIDQAVTAIEGAEAVTPEQVQGHPLVRQLVSDLLTMQDPPSLPLQGLARRLGVLPMRTGTRSTRQD